MSALDGIRERAKVAERSVVGALRFARTDIPRLLRALDAVLALADKPDMTLRHPKGDKTFLVEAHRIRSAVNDALEAGK